MEGTRISPSGQGRALARSRRRVLVVFVGGVALLATGCTKVRMGPAIGADPGARSETQGIPIVWHRLAALSKDSAAGICAGPTSVSTMMVLRVSIVDIDSPADSFLASAGQLDAALSADAPEPRPVDAPRCYEFNEWASAKAEAQFVADFEEFKSNGSVGRPALGYTMMGLLSMRDGQYEAGVRLLKRALAREPELIAAHCLLAKAYIALGYRTRALRHLREVLDADPTNAWAQRLLFGHTPKDERTKSRKYCMKPANGPSRQLCMTAP